MCAEKEHDLIPDTYKKDEGSEVRVVCVCVCAWVIQAVRARTRSGETAKKSEKVRANESESAVR